MQYPKANWPTVLNIAKSLLAVETFYYQTCDLMKSLLLPLPFVESNEPEEKTKANYIYHTILEFVCSRINQILENDDLSNLSLEAISELLVYFKEKQIREHKENIKQYKKKTKQELLQKVAEIEYKIANLAEIQQENIKKTFYNTNKRYPRGNYDPGPIKKNGFIIEEPQTEYCMTNVKDFDDFDCFYNIKSEIKAQCLPLSSIPENLLNKCKNEAPSSSLFLFNLPKKIQKEEILKLLSYVFTKEELEKNCVKIEILKGRLKGQGFLHLDSVKVAAEIRETLFGFPLQGKPLILVRDN